jgi:hypothetical protein
MGLLMRTTIIVSAISFVAALTVAILALVSGADSSEVVGAFVGVFLGTMTIIGCGIMFSWAMHG